jgi:phosphoglycerate dehydrogenase-like enzyme
MARTKDQQHLKVVLIGNVASNAREFLKARLKTRCLLCPFPVARENSELLKALADADVAVGNYFTERMVRAAKNLKLLQAPNAGVDGFCLTKLSPGTTVTNAYFHGPAVAEYVIMMILALSRDLLGLDALFRKGIWRESWTQGELPREEVLGKVLGIVGFGHIGREVAVRARALGMKIMVISAHPPARKPQGVDFWKGPAEMEQLLRASDYVVLACPLNKDTEGLIGPREFGWMKRSAYLINVSRGPVVEEAALYHALKSHRIAGAAIDVWYRYPKDNRPSRPSRFPFHKLPNLIMTPHVSGWMRGTRDQRLRVVAANIDRLVSGRSLLNVVQGPKRHSRSKGALRSSNY